MWCQMCGFGPFDDRYDYCPYCGTDQTSTDSSVSPNKSAAENQFAMVHCIGQAHYWLATLLFVMAFLQIIAESRLSKRIVAALKEVGE